MPYVLALDQGTTSSRAVVFNRRGHAMAAAQQEFAQHYPRPGWVEHDPLDLWATIRRTALRALAGAKLTGRTGLRTQIGLLDQAHLWLVCAGIIALAVIGKLLGGAIIARITSGMPWRESWLVGALLNTRGLMELVVLNIGYELGILSPTIFTMLVLMALLTTVMTGPLIGLLTGKTRLDTVTLRTDEPAKTGNP